MKLSSSFKKSRNGTVLIFLLAAMTIVSALLRTMVKIGEAPGLIGTAREYQVAADAMALSGIELMATIDEDSTNSGTQFLSVRERDLTTTVTSYNMARLFRMNTGADALNYSPPMEYPPLKDVTLTAAPTNSPTAGRSNNDIRLPNCWGQLPALALNTWTSVPGTAVAPANEYGILPSPTFLPMITDPSYPATCTTTSINGGGRLIKALQVSDVPLLTTIPTISWWGLPNSPLGTPYLPNATIVQADNASGKMPTPSLIFTRDTPKSVTGLTYTRRNYIYCWYVRSQSPGVHYYMTSGRTRFVYTSGGTETLGPEVIVSSTQLR